MAILHTALARAWLKETPRRIGFGRTASDYQPARCRSSLRWLRTLSPHVCAEIHHLSCQSSPPLLTHTRVSTFRIGRRKLLLGQRARCSTCIRGLSFPLSPPSVEDVSRIFGQ